MPPNHQQDESPQLALVQGLFIQPSPELRGFVPALLPNFSRVDDVMQETFLTVSRKAADFRAGTSFLGWACAIARFKVLEIGRRHPLETQPLSVDRRPPRPERSGP